MSLLVNARYRIIKLVITSHYGTGKTSPYSFAESGAFCFQSLNVANHKEAKGFAPLLDVCELHIAREKQRRKIDTEQPKIKTLLINTK